jgi:hypothetical protein
MKMCRIAVFVVGFTMALAAMAQEKTPERPDLTGKVVSEDGTPVSDASIFIYTAGPRVGPGYI